jgi:hypothetical protein
MTRCEDWPCCGHETGCCPDYDESGSQMNMICTCGAVLPVNSRYSICQSCMNSDDDDISDRHRSWDDDYDDTDEDGWEDDEYEQSESDQQHGNERWGDEPNDWEDSECSGGLVGWGRRLD